MNSRKIGYVCMGIGLYLLAFTAAQYEAEKKENAITYPRTILIIATVLAVVGYGYFIYRKHGGAPPASPSMASVGTEPEYRPEPTYEYRYAPMPNYEPMVEPVQSAR